MLLTINETELKADQALSHVLALWPIVIVLHHHVECISGEESASESLYLHRHADQVASLSLYERLWVVITLPANRAEALLHALVALELLKIIQASAMIDVTAAKDRLVLKLQVLEADRARLTNLTSLQKLLLDVDPFVLA